MSIPSAGELFIVFLIILFLFGANRIPKIARDLGSGIREFKRSMNGEDKDQENNKG
jgi:sec-independent protein translocase protein TatA